MKECTAKTITEKICDLFEVDPDDSYMYFQVYDISRDYVYKYEGIELPVA